MVARGSVCMDARMINASGIGTCIQGLLSVFKSRKDLPISLSLAGEPSALSGFPWPVARAKAPIYSLREQWEIPGAFRKSGATLLHVPHYNMPLLDASRTIVSVMDLIHLKFPEYWPSPIARAYARFFFHQVVPRARHILTISESTKKDMVEMLSIPAERITVTYPAVWHKHYQDIPAEDQSAFVKLGLPKDYLLYVGNLKEFKNVERLVEAYRRLKASRGDVPPLVLVGRNFIPGFEKRIEEARALWIGQVPGNLLPSLYKNALAFLFPSLYEGFGLPPLEAMASGTPVLSSNRGSLPEVVGDAALLVDPENVDAITSGMEQLSHDSGLRMKLSAKGLAQAARFSWERMADQTLRAYEACLS